MSPFGPEALVQAQAEASALDFSDLARECAGRLKLRAMADRMRDQLRAELERPAIDVTGSSPTEAEASPLPLERTPPSDRA